MSPTPVSPYDEKFNYSNRFFLFFIIAVCFFSVICIRLWTLQVLDGESYRERSEQNRIRTIDLSPQRGLIYDRNGQVLVTNEGSYNLLIVPNEIQDKEDIIFSQLANILENWEEEELREKFKKLTGNKHNAHLFIENLSYNELRGIENKKYKLKGLEISAGTARKPLEGLFASHLIGYLAEINEDKLKEEEYSTYLPGDKVGQGGVERTAEQYLHGSRGKIIQEVDSRGRILEVIENVRPQAGDDVYLTLDARLQKAAQAILREKAGAIVAIDVNTFEILAAASSPNFDQTDFIGGISNKRWRSLSDDKFRPLINRAVAGQYAPGSTFKIVMALTGLKEKVITPQTVFHCPGFIMIGKHRFGCWRNGGHGAVDLHRSLRESCDVYYYELGRRLGAEKLAENAEKYFGLNTTNSIDVHDEKKGLIPTAKWKKERAHNPQAWYLGDTISASIGQGDVLATPLQVAQYTAVAANGGKLYKPFIIKEVFDQTGKLVKKTEPSLVSTLEIPEDDFKRVQNALLAVVEEGGGTGRRAGIPGVKVAGKSGTSQVVSLKVFRQYNNLNRPYKYKDHAWFSGYAPADNPKIAVAVLLEHSGGGGTFAGPVFKEFLEYYFDEEKEVNNLPKAQVQPDKPEGWDINIEVIEP